MENHEKLISVIIPTYGRPDYLLRAIRSVESQSYLNVEIIIVDDNGLGTDNQIETYAKLKETLEKNVNIKYLAHEQNKNGSGARNTGIENSNGEFICFLDDDDEFHEDKLSKQLSRLIELGESWVGCYTGHERIFDRSNRINIEYLPEKEGYILYDILSFGIDHVSGSSLMVRKNVLEKTGVWNEELKRHQDYEFIAKVANAGKIAVVSSPLVKIHVHEGSYSHKKLKQIEQTRLDYLKFVKPLIMSLTTKESEEIFRLNYFWLFKQSIKHNNVNKSLYYLKKCRINMHTLKLLCTHFIGWSKRNIAFKKGKPTIN